MARTIHANTLALMSAGMIAKADLVRISLPSPIGDVGFFSGTGEFTWGSVTFKGTGDLVDIDVVGGNVSGIASGLVIRLNTMAREGLGESVLTGVESVQYRGAIVTIYRRYMDPVTYEVSSTETLWNGRIDRIEYETQEGGNVLMLAYCEGLSIDLSRSGYRMRSDADHRASFPTDGFLKHTATVETKEIQVGRIPKWTPPAKKKKGFLGGLFG